MTIFNTTSSTSSPATPAAAPVPADVTAIAQREAQAARARETAATQRATTIAMMSVRLEAGDRANPRNMGEASVSSYIARAADHLDAAVEYVRYEMRPEPSAGRAAT